MEIASKRKRGRKRKKKGKGKNRRIFFDGIKWRKIERRLVVKKEQK